MKSLSLLLSAIVLIALSACQSVDRGSFGQFKRSLNTTDYGYSIIEDPTGSAPTKMVERFEVRPGDCGSDSGWSDCKKDRERSELSQTNQVKSLGTSKWYGWSIYIPDDYVNIYPTKVALGQFHQKSGPVIWMFQNDKGGYHLDDQMRYRYYKLIDEKDLRGKWHRIAVHAKWSKGEDGFFKVWVNGEQKVDYIGSTMTVTSTYFKYGVYRSYMTRYRGANGVEDVPAQTVLFANVRRSDSREGLTAPE